MRLILFVLALGLTACGPETAREPVVAAAPAPLGEQEVAALIERLDRWLAANRPEYYVRLQPGVTDEILDAVEEKFKVKLPASFRALYRWRNGQEADESANFVFNWMFMSLGDVVYTKELTDDMVGYDYDDKHWNPGWIPFGANGGGSHLCLDMKAALGGTPGQILEFWKADKDRPVVHPSFDAFLTSLVTSMEEGTYEAFESWPKED